MTTTTANVSGIIDTANSMVDLRDWVELLDEAEEGLANLDDEEIGVNDFDEMYGEDAAREFVEFMTSLASDLGCPDLDALRDYANNEPTMIHDSYRVDYAKEYADDIIGMNDTSWPFNHIDWDEAADDLFSDDWSSIEIDDETYWIRNA